MSDPTGYPPPGQQPDPYGLPVSPSYPPYGGHPPTAPIPAAPDPYALPSAGQYPAGPSPVVASARRKSSLWLWVALGVVLLLLTCCGAVGVWFAVTGDGDPQAAPSVSVTPSRGTPSSAPVSHRQIVTVSLPSTLGGRTKQDDPATTALAETMRESVEGTLPGDGKTIAAVYGDIIHNDMLIVVASEAAIPGAATVLDGMFSSTAANGGIKNIVDVAPGPLGGEARCGDATSAGLKLATCAWIDEGSFGMMFFYNRTVNQIKSEFIELRSDVETKG